LKKKEIIARIIAILKEWKKDERVDIELLLEALDKLKNRRNESILQFTKDTHLCRLTDGIIFDDNEMDELLYNLIDDLKSFIRLKTIVGKDKIGYRKHFRGFIEESLDKKTPLDIISLNYDTCIEQFCNFHKKNYQDGFDLYWNKDAFNKAKTDIRLYKLHGSVIWYQSDNGAYIKLPIQNGSGELKLISGEKAENLMLYPMQKWDYAEPLLELLLHVKYLLESDIENDTQEDLKSTANDFKFLIAVGYSFRDGHIKKIILDSAKNNRKLYLIIIDPDANGIYERLKYYDNSREAESDLSGKMICLPYKFEGVFPYLTLTFLCRE